MKRQGMIVTIKELRKLADELEEEQVKEGTFFQVNIINKEGLSDTWELEGSKSQTKVKKVGKAKIKWWGRTYGHEDSQIMRGTN